MEKSSYSYALTASSMTIKLSSLGNHSFINCYPHMIPYRGYETLAHPYLSARLTMESDIPMTISWGVMGIETIPSSGLYILINFKKIVK